MVVKTNRENETWTKSIIQPFGKGIEILAEMGGISKKECFREREREEG